MVKTRTDSSSGSLYLFLPQPPTKGTKMSQNDSEKMLNRIASLEKRLQRHDDTAEILTVVGRYSRALDRNDASLLKSVFHDDAEVDYGFYSGGIREFLPIIMGASRVRDRTWHCAAQTQCNFVNDRSADVDSYCLAVGFDPVSQDEDRPPLSTLFQGHYFDRFVFRDSRWAIQHRTFRVLGAVGIQEIALDGQLASLNRMPSLLAAGS